MPRRRVACGGEGRGNPASNASIAAGGRWPHDLVQSGEFTAHRCLQDTRGVAPAVGYDGGRTCARCGWRIEREPCPRGGVGGKRLGIDATIVMPSNAPKTKIAATQALGAKIVFYDRLTQDRDAIAAELVAQSGGTLVHAFANPWVIEGQGSAGIEIIEQLRARGIDGPDHIIACCGGGGLAAGLSLACPDARISIAEPEGWDDVIRSLDAGKIVPVIDPAYPTPCDALQTPSTFPINFAVLNGRIDGTAIVTPAEVGAAMRLAFEKLHLVVEPGGAAALAAVLAAKIVPHGTAVVTLSGGNVDWETYASIIQN